jgi:phospholipase C
MPTDDKSHALDHIVVVLFENRSLDNVLGHLYGPEDGKTFDGVIGKDLSNPIPEWAEHGADRKVVPYTIATDMDSPNPDSGEEYFHTNTQLLTPSTITIGARSARPRRRRGTRRQPARRRRWTGS